MAVVGRCLGVEGSGVESQLSQSVSPALVVGLELDEARLSRPNARFGNATSEVARISPISQIC